MRPRTSHDSIHRLAAGLIVALATLLALAPVGGSPRVHRPIYPEPGPTRHVGRDVRSTGVGDRV